MIFKILWRLFPNDDAYIKLVIDWSSDINIKSINFDLWFGQECVLVETCWCKNEFWVVVKKLDAKCSGVWEMRIW